MNKVTQSIYKKKVDNLEEGGGGGKLYRHQVHFEIANSAVGDVVIFNNTSTPFTNTSLIEYLSSYSSTNYYLTTGIYYDSGKTYSILGLFKYPNDTYPLGVVYSNTLYPQNTGFPASANLNDTVTEV